MPTPGSVFIMDVSQSSAMQQPDQLTDHLRDTATWLNEVAQRHPEAFSFKHRFGDEVLLVARNYETAYLVAFYVAATWPFFDHSPYFGASYGHLLRDVPANEDLDTWISPIIKWARNAADALKQEKAANRVWLQFNDGRSPGSKLHRSTAYPGGAPGSPFIADVLNEYALVQDRFWKLQTKSGRIASALFTLFGRQDEVALTLNKHPSTISRQIRSCNIDIILTLKDRVIDILHTLELANEPQDMTTNASSNIAPHALANRQAMRPRPAHVLLEVHIREALHSRIGKFLDRVAQADKD